MGIFARSSRHQQEEYEGPGHNLSFELLLAKTDLQYCVGVLGGLLVGTNCCYVHDLRRLDHLQQLGQTNGLSLCYKHGKL